LSIEIFALVGVGFLIAVAALGCGRKAMPSAPKKEIPAAVKDLSYRLDGSLLTLTWSVPKSHPPVTGFRVYRSRVPAAQSGCTACTVEFSEVANLSVQAGAGGESEQAPMQFSETIDPGYHYIYKVVTADEQGTPGPDSNHVDLDF
jgi:hypothetical protein